MISNKGQKSIFLTQNNSTQRGFSQLQFLPENSLQQLSNVTEIG